MEGERLARGELTLEEAASRLNASRETVRRLILSKVLSARQACKGAPWIIEQSAVERLMNEANAVNGPRTKDRDQLALKLQ